MLKVLLLTISDSKLIFLMPLNLACAKILLDHYSFWRIIYIRYSLLHNIEQRGTDSYKYAVALFHELAQRVLLTNP